VTPDRSKQVLTNKFSVAYGIANDCSEVAIANPTRNKITIKKNCQVAEFHPRDENAFAILQCGGEQPKSQQWQNGGRT
jgi:hypothetical protein